MVISCPGISAGTVQKLIDYLYSGQTTIRNRGQKKDLDSFVDMFNMKISLDEEAVSQRLSTHLTHFISFFLVLSFIQPSTASSDSEDSAGPPTKRKIATPPIARKVEDNNGSAKRKPEQPKSSSGLVTIGVKKPAPSRSPSKSSSKKGGKDSDSEDEDDDIRSPPAKAGRRSRSSSRSTVPSLSSGISN